MIWCNERKETSSKSVDHFKCSFNWLCCWIECAAVRGSRSMTGYVVSGTIPTSYNKHTRSTLLVTRAILQAHIHKIFLRNKWRLDGQKWEPPPTLTNKIKYLVPTPLKCLIPIQCPGKAIIRDALSDCEIRMYCRT